jgi:phosphohistidine phosphatase SixA
MARRLGERIGERGRIRLFSSPVQRCVDTASLIAEGAGCDAQVTVTTMLGMPGTYVIDEREVDRHLAVMGLHRFAVEWVNGRIRPGHGAGAAGGQALMGWSEEHARSSRPRIRGARPLPDPGARQLSWIRVFASTGLPASRGFTMTKVTASDAVRQQRTYL